MGYTLAVHARKDLKNIAIYTRKKWGTEQGKLYLEDLRMAFEQLAALPGKGRLREELAEGLRSFQIAHHVVYYVEADNGISIARILHPSMDVENQLKP